MNRFPCCVHLLLTIVIATTVLPLLAQETAKPTAPDKVYVPYGELKRVFERTDQGIFLPYSEFERLWKKAQGRPADAKGVPLPYLISAARFTGETNERLASLKLLLTIDVLSDNWISMPIGLGQVAVAKTSFQQAPQSQTKPLLLVSNGSYHLLVKGKGRYVLAVDFVCQLLTKPGQNILQYRVPAAAISTLDLLIPEENMKVGVAPLLAASTSQTKDKKTRLQAFLGNAGWVKLTWQPKTQAAADLTPVIICNQQRHIHVGEALISQAIVFNYDIRRRGIKRLTINLPDQWPGPKPYRVTAVEGENLSKWDITSRKVGERTVQNLEVELFSEVKDKYVLTVKLERFLQEKELQLPITPITTQQVLRRSGLLAVTRVSRRAAEVRNPNSELVRVDIGQLPKPLRRQTGATAYRYTSNTYAGTLAIGTVLPRVSVHQQWLVSIDRDMQFLNGRLNYDVDRAGVFSLKLILPEPWEVTSIEPDTLIEDFGFTGKGAGRLLTVALEREAKGKFTMRLQARAPRAAPETPVHFQLPAAAPDFLHLHSGEIVFALIDSLRAEVKGSSDLRPLALRDAATKTANDSRVKAKPAMAFAFRTVDPERKKLPTVDLTIAEKPAQISATAHRLVNIQPGSVEHHVVLSYRIRYAPVDVFYLKLPKSIADLGPQITGIDIKEKPRIDALPADQTEPGKEGEPEWAYYKIALQAPVRDRYTAEISWRQTFQVDADSEPKVSLLPVLAAGRLSDQTGHIAVAKAPTLAIGRETMDGLVPGDAGSAVDVPNRAHRQNAIKAYRHSTPEFRLELPIRLQKDAKVFTTIANAVIIEQAIARDGTLNARAVFLLSSSRGDRIEVSLPKAEVYSFLLNGSEVAFEQPTADSYAVRLPPSAGQVSKQLLEVTYGVKKASTRHLPAPVLPESVPVQRTYWRIWAPADYRLLGYDRNFAREGETPPEMLVQMIWPDHRAALSSFSSQGKLLCFGRQGPADELSVCLVSRLVLCGTVWLLVLGAGIYGLKYSGIRRLQVVLGLIALTSFIYLYQPLFVGGIAGAARWGIALVVVLWLARHIINRKRNAPAGNAAPPPKDTLPAKPKPRRKNRATKKSSAGKPKPKQEPKQPQSEEDSSKTNDSAPEESEPKGEG